MASLFELAIDAVNALRGKVINAQTGTSYEIVLADAGKAITLTNGGAISLDIPAESGTDFDIGTILSPIIQGGAGLVTVTPAMGVTVNALGAGLAFSGQWGIGALMKTGSDAWVFFNLTPDTSAPTFIPPRVASTASSATPTPNADTTDVYILTAQGEAAAFDAPTGTPVQGQPLIIRIEDDGTARALSWDAAYRALGVTLPTTTTLGKTMYLGLLYNSTDSVWDVVSVVEQA